MPARLVGVDGRCRDTRFAPSHSTRRRLWRDAGGTHDRASLLVSALRLSYFTIAWNGVVGVAALVVALATGSFAMAGFALNAVLDSSASVVRVWRFKHERRDPAAAERLERHAQALIAAAMLTIAAYVGVQAIRALVGGSHPETTAFGVALALSRSSYCRSSASGSSTSPRA